jgi:hypothetical protein
MMGIKATINEILQKRHKKVADLEIIIRDLSELEVKIDDILNFSHTEDEVANFNKIISTVCNEFDEFRSEILNVKSSAVNLMNRFKRKTVNIGVAGKARQGKSTLLQSISGLSDTVIPTSDALPCTGAKSKIYHYEEKPYAKIDFYTKDAFLKEIIHPYFVQLNLPKPTSLDNFFEPVAEYNGSDNIDRNLEKAIIGKLQFIYEAFPSFQNLLSEPSKKLDELGDIADYVTQSERRTKYLAAKAANIYTKFPHSDITNLGLVDLPGLEAAQGHERKLVDSLEHEVDAVIFVKLPSAKGTQYDKDDYKVIDLIDAAVKEVDLADWLFIALNRLDDNSNEKQVQLLKDNPPETYSRANILIANCNNSANVEENIFSVVLRHLELNLEKIDTRSIEVLAKRIKSISENIENEISRSKEMLKPQTQDRKMNREHHKLTNKFINEMKTKLNDLKTELRNALGEAGSDFQLKVEEICDLAEQANIIPSPDELERKYKEEGGWPSAVQDELHYLRSKLSSFLAEKFDEYFVQQVKKTLLEVLERIFKATLPLIAAEQSDVERDPFEMLRELEKLFDKSMQPQLCSSFDYISKFNFSYHSHFHHRVRMEMWRLDTHERTFERTFVDRIIPKGETNKQSLEEDAEEIARAFDVNYKETLFDIKKKFKEEMQSDPAQAIFSLVEEIGDRLVRARDIDEEWDDFIYQTRSQILPDIFNQFDQYATLCKNWQTASDDLLISVRRVNSAFLKLVSK